MKTLDTAAENRAYMDGFLKAKQANGLDWARAEVEVIALRDRINAIMAEKDYEIHCLKVKLQKQKWEYEDRITDLESHIEALKLAWKHRGDKD